MNWYALAAELISRVPIERVLFPAPDHSKELAEFAQSLGADELSDADIKDRIRSVYELREWAGDDVERRERVLRISKELERE